MDEADQALDIGHMQNGGPIDLVTLAADIVSAYVSNNRVPPAELPTLLSNVHAAVAGLGSTPAVADTGPEKPTSAQIRRSIKPDALISFIDGKSYKTLKRHLNKNGMTIEEYRERFGLPRDYPSTAASYSEQRSALAKSLGLGQQRRKAAPKVALVAEAISEVADASDRAKVSPLDEKAAKARKAKKPASAAAE